MITITLAGKVIRRRWIGIGSACAAWLLCSTVEAHAQRVWIVDAENRPGTDFLDMPPAIASAADSDTIVVRASSVLPRYSDIVVSKGVTIVGDGRPLVVNITVQGIMRYQTCTISQMRTTLVHVNDCQGTVCFDRIEPAVDFPPLIPSAVSVYSRRNGLVALTDSYVEVDAEKSTLLLSRCSFRGLPAGFETRWRTKLWDARPGINCTDSWIVVSGGIVRGGSDNSNFTPFLGKPAIRLNSGTLVIAGDASTRLEPGFNMPSPGAIETFGGEILLDPSVQLVPAVITGPARVTRQRLAALQGVGAGPGGDVHVELFWRAGEAALLVAGTPGQRLPLPPLGDLWLAPLTVVPIAATVIDASEHWSIALRVPPDVRRGAPFGFQALGTLSRSVLLSTPLFVALAGP